MLQEFRVSLEAGSAAMRVVPYGEPIQHGRNMIQFDTGSIEVPDTVPVIVGHDREDLSKRIGVLVQHADQTDALYGEVDFAETQLAQEMRSLAAVGAITDVSAGIWVTDEVKDSAGVVRQYGKLDHIALVHEGAFGEAGQGSKLLAVHSKEGNTMEEDTKVAEATVEPVSLAEFTAEVAEFRKMVAEQAVGTTGEKRPEKPFADMKEFVLTVAETGKGNIQAMERMQEYALADDTTTGAAGLVPDYFSTEVIGIIDSARPYLSAITRDPIGSNGMTVKYPRRTQKPAVDAQSAEKTEVASQSTTFDFLDVDLVTYAGASDVSLQLIERSAPSFVSRLFQELGGVYAEKTSADAIADAVANAAGTAVVADLGADADATWAAVAAASAAVAQGVRRPANTIVVSIDRWAELLTLTDVNGRPLILADQYGRNNAQGGGSLSEFNFSYGGLRGIVDPNAAAGTCIVMWDGSTAYVEQTPQELRALQVSLLGMDMGVWSLFSHIVKYDSGLYTLTVA